MATWSEPRKFNLEVLSEEGFVPDSRVETQMVDIEFVDKSHVRIDSSDYSIFTEGIEEFAGIIGISAGYLKKLPDDLFAYTMNYFLRRGEDSGLVVFFDEDFVINGVQFDTTFRLNFEDIIQIVLDSCNKGEELLMSEFSRDGDDYTITVLGDPFEDEIGIVYPSLTVKINDRLLKDTTFTYGVFRWGPRIMDTHPFYTTGINKSDTPDTALDRIEEDFTEVYSGINDWFSDKKSKSESHTVELPREIFDKVLKEYKINKKRGDILDISEIFYDDMNAYDISQRLSDVSTIDAISPSIARKLEKIAGYALGHIYSDHRCDKCLSHVEN